MTLTFPALSENERFARLAVSGFLSVLDPNISELSDIKTAVSEAVTNAIVHGYRDTAGEVMMQVRIFKDSHISIKIQDKGCGIPDVEQAMTPLYTTSPEEDRAGLGFTIMETFMEKIKVKSKPGKGTTVILERTVQGKKRL
ncbi:MAG: anti-sigma F factor [Ruminococcus sp.]|uniref:anti-sigma F factor n=1 Tax=Ruminococcus sp. TaxID=41978 RepID=UPI0025F6F64C|nr:anti-sigma F factor [Ruminococcus sp.]MBO4867083.1 anti-sigma F factor [Ruminococcus sp.]